MLLALSSSLHFFSNLFAAEFCAILEADPQNGLGPEHLARVYTDLAEDLGADLDNDFARLMAEQGVGVAADGEIAQQQGLEAGDTSVNEVHVALREDIEDLPLPDRMQHMEKRVDQLELTIERQQQQLQSAMEMMMKEKGGCCVVM